MAFKGQAQTVWDRVCLASIPKGWSRHRELRDTEKCRLLTRSTDFVLCPQSVFNIYSCFTSLLFHLFPHMMYNSFWHSLICCQRKHHCLFSNTPPFSYDLCFFYHVGKNTCFLTDADHIQALSHLVFCILHSTSTNTGFVIIVRCCGPSPLGLRPCLQGYLAPSSGLLLRVLSQNLSSENKVALLIQATTLYSNYSAIFSRTTYQNQDSGEG